MKPLSRSDYEVAFSLECRSGYPTIDLFERVMGYAIGTERLEAAARTLACPVKVNRPNWQHGRVIYAAARNRLDSLVDIAPLFLDIGTAKGFSALCLAFALADHAIAGRVVSVDVIDPAAAVARNSVAELDGLLSVFDFVRHWPEADTIDFRKATGVEWLKAGAERIHFAFVDGKHSYSVVQEEFALLATLQRPGDVAVFDDLQIVGVRDAVMGTRDYKLLLIDAKESRKYAVATRV